MKPIFDYCKGLYTLCPHPNIVMPKIRSGIIEYHHLGLGEFRTIDGGKSSWMYTEYLMDDCILPRGDNMGYRYMRSMWTKV